ncbi:MAG: hypothetical protein HKO63_04615 [Acidimicrobiia bacterium]|nr:hypothetical protein [Acidimicrobiia bacterium]NNL97468.1 hypothetical protein [Acidimicrobiia bacterium]
MAYVLFFVLFGLLVAVGVGFAWQETRRPDSTVFGMREAVAYIYGRMDSGLKQGLRPADIERIVGWELRYVDEQRRSRDSDEPVVVASLAGGAYAQQKAIEEGFTYDGPIIEEVLRLEAEYLASLGAVGEEVAGS